jgi:hypothetical protein
MKPEQTKHGYSRGLAQYVVVITLPLLLFLFCLYWIIGQRPDLYAGSPENKVFLHESQPTPESRIGEKIPGLYWNELPTNVQTAVETLGYNQHAWDETNSLPVAFEKEWDKLTDEEKTAAREIGYSSENWDPISYHIYDSLNWNQLPKNIQNAMSTLGYDKQMWDDSNVRPASFQKYWDDLTEDEKTAANEIGCKKEYWDGE